MKKIGLVAGLLMLGLASTAGAADKTQFEFWYGLSGDLGERVQDVCKKFNESQADFEIVCTSQNDYATTLQNTIAAYRAKKNPTITQIFDAGTLDLMLSGAAVPAKKLMADNAININWDDYFPGIGQLYATKEGEMLSFPFNSSTGMLYYNKDAFAKAGIEGAPATWDDVQEDAKKLKAAGYDCPFAFSMDTWTTVEQFSAINDLPIATKSNGFDGLDAELVINKTPVVAQLAMYQKMAADKLFVVKTKQLGEELVPSFATGHCQMITSSIADHGTIGKTAAPDMHWEVAMLPTLKGVERHKSLVGGASLWVLGNRSEAEYKGAAQFLAFIGSPEMAEYWSTVTGYIPVTVSGFEAMKANGFYDKAPYKGREKAIESLTATAPGPNTRGIRLGSFPQIRKEISTGMEAIFYNNADVQATLDDVVARSNDILRRFEKTYAKTN
jgi:sn-glycerol 3-phosphate transport system substrate-binding protein